MKCPNCQHENPDATKFCGECGTQLTPSGEAQPSFTKTIETPQEELSTGSVFANRYQVIEELGKGGMGKVYRVLDKKLNEEVALKLIKPDIASDKRTLERFKNELKLARKVAHKNVGKMFDLGEETGTHYITMEYVPGEDLKSFIRRIGQIPVGKSISIAKQLCEGLYEAHNIGIVHRDLKPSNIMIDKQGNARIMDFGIARSMEAKKLTGAGVIIGTPEYMSPEQVEGKETDQRSDIYSLGVILYEMLAARLPFEGDTPLSIAVQHRSDTPKDPTEFNPQISEDLSTAILKCLEKEKRARFQTAKELLSTFSQIEEGIPTTERFTVGGRPLTTREITERRIKRKRRIRLAFGCAVIILAVTTASYFLFIRGQRTISSVAVLPMKDLSGEQDHVTYGLTASLIRELGKIGSFNKVTSQQSVIQYAGSTKPMPVIAEELGVDALIESHLLPVGDKMEIYAGLFNAKKDQLLWSDTYNRDREDIMNGQLEGEIVREIAQEVRVRLTADERERLSNQPPVDPEANEAYMRGMQFLMKGTLEGGERGLQYFKQAQKLDPDFALAYFGEALYYRYLGAYYILPASQAYPKARDLAEKAIEIDDTLAEAHALLGVVHLFYDWDWQAAEKKFHQAIKLNPNCVRAHTGYFLYLTHMERYEESSATADRILELDPLGEESIGILAGRFMYTGQYDLAIEKYEEFLDMNPNNNAIRLHLAEAYKDAGMYDQALKIANELVKQFEEDEKIRGKAWLATINASAGKTDEAQKLLNEVFEFSKQVYVTPIAIAGIYASLGSADQAFKYLDKAYDERDHGMVRLKTIPWFNNLHSDPRFIRLVKKVGLPE